MMQFIQETPTLDFLNYPLFPALDQNGTWQGTGNNHKGMVLLGRGINAAEQGVFLDKILGAIQINRQNDTTCIDLDGQTVHFAQILTRLHPKVGILFGVLPEEIAWRVQLPWYEWVEWNGGKWLQAHSLTDLQTKQQAYKKHLWSCLQGVEVQK